MSKRTITDEPRSWQEQQSEAEAASARLRDEVERLKERVRVLGAKALAPAEDEGRREG
jgi:hypothetical protein